MSKVCTREGRWSVGGLVSFNFDVEVEAETEAEARDLACEIAAEAPWEDQNVLDNTGSADFVKLGEVDCLEETVWEEEESEEESEEVAPEESKEAKVAKIRAIIDSYGDEKWTAAWDALLKSGVWDGEV